MGHGRVAAVVRECVKCGRPFHPWKATRGGQYCSRACSPKGRQPTLVDIPCEVCGVLFRPLKQRRRFCSRACYVTSGKRLVNSQGYIVVYAAGEPGAYPSGQILEHRLVMQRVLGRPLAPHETVHHKNAIKTDNRPENLELWSNRHPKGARHGEHAPHCPTCTCGK